MITTQEDSVPIFDKIHANRLTELANKLLSEEPLLVGNFDFAVYFIRTDNCGTSGCALGEAHSMWPEAKLMVLDNFGDFDKVNFNNAYDWFGITKKEFYHLFVPESQSTKKFNENHLNVDATATMVANNIIEFLKVKSLEL